MAEAEPAQAGLQSFPTDPRKFDSDERISFSRLDNKHIGVLDDGSEVEWDVQLKRWIPTVDEEVLAQQRAAYYGGGGDDEVDDEMSDNSSQTNRKRKNRSATDQRPKKKPRAPPKERQNTAIYVTGLPLDVTVDEVHEAFSRKCGVIAEEIDSGRPRIKLYTDDKGNLQGDALIVFFKPQSVEMAIMLLDDTDFRYTASGLSSGRMRVQAAEAKYKKTNYEEKKPVEGGGDGGAGSSVAENNVESHNPITGAGKPRDKVREQDKQKVIKRTQKLDAKLADWDDDDVDGPFSTHQPETTNVSKKDRVVTLRHMFTLRELEEDPAAMLEIKEDIRDECAKLGEVTNVVLYDLEEEGIASVKFKTPEAAAACVELMDGRAFDGRTVRAAISSGSEKYRRSDKAHDVEGEED
jgi:HIV Tat-specific factor 1